MRHRKLRCHRSFSDSEFFTGTEGRYVMNLSDRRNMLLHPDPERKAGCCGLAGCDGPNQLCECGAEVATEKSDCWMPHALIIEPDAVVVTETDGHDRTSCARR